MSDKERALLLEALSRHGVHVRECIDTCERDVQGLPPTKPGVLTAYREELAMLDRLYAKIQAQGKVPKLKCGGCGAEVEDPYEHVNTYGPRFACLDKPAEPVVPPSDPAALGRQEISMERSDIKRLVQTVRAQVGKFSDRRLNDGDDVWREREIEYRCGIAETANALCDAFQLAASSFAAACGLYVSDGRDTYSDCRPGELTWEKPRGDVS